MRMDKACSVLLIGILPLTAACSTLSVDESIGEDAFEPIDLSESADSAGEPDDGSLDTIDLS